MAINNLEVAHSCALVTPVEGGLGEFRPYRVLWEAGPEAIFNSEPSARWFMRQHGADLASANAVGLHAGRWIVHPTRFRAVAEAIATKKARARLLTAPNS